MNLVREHHAESGGGDRDRALSRIVAEIHAGLRHGYFEYSLTCEVVGHDRRRLVLHAGKSYQFVIPGDECGSTDRLNTPDDRSRVDACVSHGPDHHPFYSPHVNPTDS